RRLRRRAPKLPRANAPTRTRRRLTRRLRWPRARISARAEPGRRQTGWGRDGRAASRPYATIALVAISLGTWAAWHAKPDLYFKLTIAGPRRGVWGKLVPSQSAYANGLYEFVALVAIALFGWLLERRRGPAVVLALFLGGGVAGALVASAVYADPLVSGGNAAALPLLAAWAVPGPGGPRVGT